MFLKRHVSGFSTVFLGREVACDVFKRSGCEVAVGIGALVRLAHAILVFSGRQVMSERVDLAKTQEIEQSQKMHTVGILTSKLFQC